MLKQKFNMLLLTIIAALAIGIQSKLIFTLDGNQKTKIYPHSFGISKLGTSIADNNRLRASDTVQVNSNGKQLKMEKIYPFQTDFLIDSVMNKARNEQKTNNSNTLIRTVFQNIPNIPYVPGDKDADKIIRTLKTSEKDLDLLHKYTSLYYTKYWNFNNTV